MLFGYSMPCYHYASALECTVKMVHVTRMLWQKEEQVPDANSKPRVSTYTMAWRHHIPKTNAHSCL
jgi:hypothetical protein